MKLVVKKRGRQWDIVDRTTNKVVEGGFFNVEAAYELRDTLEREALADEVEKAERAAGWDPNP